jgi:hypothetical protein
MIEKQPMKETKVEVSIDRKPSIVEVWYEGSVTVEGTEHKFWLIDPQTPDPAGNVYEIEVRWFFKQVPMEIRRMSDQIAQQYLEMRNEK